MKRLRISRRLQVKPEPADGRRANHTGLVPLLLLIAAAGAAPLVSAVYNSFFHDVFGRRSFAGLENFARLFGDAGLFYSLRITIGWALLNAGLSLLLGLVLASLLFEARRGFRTLFIALLVPWGVPLYIAVPLWRMIIHGNGGVSLLSRLLGLQVNLLQEPVAAFFAVLAVSVWMNLPLNGFVFYAVLRKTSRSVLEAAAMDGAGRWVRFSRLYLPISAGTAAVMGVLNFIGSFKEFTLPFMMTAGGPPLVSGITEHYIIGATTTVEILLYELFRSSPDFGLPAAYSLVAMAIVMLLMVFWVFVKRGETRRSRVAWLLAAAELLLGAAAGLAHGAGQMGASLAGAVLALLFLLGSRWRAAFKAALVLDLWYGLFSLLSGGFLGGLHLPSLVVLASLLVLYRNRGHRGHRMRGRGLKIEAVKSKAQRGLWPYRLRRAGRGLLSLFRGAGIRRTQVPRPRRPGNAGNAIWTAAGGILAGGMVLTAVLMLYMVLWLSFSDLHAAYIDQPVPRFFTLENYRAVFLEENILRYFANTLLAAGATAVLVPVVTFPAAYSAVKLSHAGAGRLFFLVQVLGLIGGMHALIPLFALFRIAGLINTYVPVVLIYILHAVPFALFTTYSYLERMPRELEETAVLEGTSRGQYLLRILLPLSYPVISAGMMVAFIGAWNGFLVPLIFLQDDSRFTIGVKLHEYVGSLAAGAPQWGLFAAASVVNMLIIGILLYRFRDPLERGQPHQIF